MNAPAQLPRYPKSVEIKRLVAAGRAAGLDVAGIEVAPDGTIRIVEARALPTKGTLFDKLEAEGRI